MRECEQSQFQQFFQIQGQINQDVLVDLSHNPTHSRLYGYNIYIVAKFGTDTDWSIFADARFYTESNMANFRIKGR